MMHFTAPSFWELYALLALSAAQIKVAIENEELCRIKEESDEK